jgi:hypothetical protein
MGFSIREKNRSEKKLKVKKSGATNFKFQNPRIKKSAARDFEIWFFRFSVFMKLGFAGVNVGRNGERRGGLAGKAGNRSARHVHIAQPAV